ncbi:RluA family pseudouridine synthase [Mesoplasma melaleucae]|uniref:RNA pseudouridylate synthase n=1 Tax=Mesoplasma melaleucae TaxID=81459 RepID=A0A2K8NXI4_9MOLU|nr:RluA family pseudouridine synthase [Mesoplasma melaleucae]ATZ18256.1 23S rRNA pseudouridine955/2504/2580 synthase [Mesoplasma melaleucae]
MNKFIANQNDDNQTLFKFLKKNYKTTPLSVIYKWLRKGDIKINDKRIKDKDYLIKANDEIVVYDNNKPVLRDNFKKIKDYALDIVYEDSNILIVLKPYNVEVHSLVKESMDDIVKSYLVDSNKYNPSEENSYVVSHIHRLDKLTSGLLMYAKNKQAHDILVEAIQDKDKIEKYYCCKIDVPVTESLDAKGWIKYDPIIQKSVFSEEFKPDYKEATTIFNVVSLDVTNKQTELEVQILTGRKHQIRATLEYYGAPIINDWRYSGTMINNEKMIFLFANKLVFNGFKGNLENLNGKIVEIEPTW